MRSELLLDHAGDLLGNGRAGQAATLLAPVVGADPGNLGAWLLLARAHLALGRPAEALEAARTALALRPGGFEALYWVSASYTAMGRHELAVTAAAAAVQDDPGNPRLAERHGRALLAAGRVAEAELLLAASVEIASYDAELHVAYGMALFAAGRPLSAREAYGKALALDPGNAPALTELRRLTAAERRITDAASLVRVCDEFAETLRIPAGGRPHRAAARDALGHVAAVAFGVCLVTLLGLAAAIRVAGVEVPLPLLIGVFTAAGAAACVTALTRRAR
ncbi:tetratricopeptide repeat protein [Paractinoplanes deccanensis]|uniref:tetratricopeptide repeat protein n=1 Tax=Paractinoplanes deccanensis TaxID=113561 RepID=UPI001942ECC5|nr:tetratricopeptide repeat protein [Actinoplanes deccanensis]